MMSFKNKIVGIGCGVLSALSFAACSDWNEHYDADTSVLGSQQATLWQNIEKDGELQQFATLMKKIGYDQVLSSSQSFTVWAPKDGTYNYDELIKEADSAVIKKFAQNHIAQSNILASGLESPKKIFMLNKKMMIFTGSEMQGIGLDAVDIGCGNGTIHKLQSKIPYLLNIYESLSSEAYPVDSISDYFWKHHKDELDKAKSVAGSAKDGEIVYLDSVMRETNTLFSLFNAYLNREDSNYTMVLPTNDAWTKAKDSIKKYFNYISNFRVQQTTAQNTDTIITVTLRNPEQLQDSMANRMLAQDLFYNNNIYGNVKLKNFQAGEKFASGDSLVSTHQKDAKYDSKIYAEDANLLFSNARREERSNGVVWIADELNMRSWTTWNPEIRIEAESENSRLKATMTNPEKVTVSVGSQNPAVTGHISDGAYMLAKPASKNVHPELYFNLAGVRSTTYSIYLVIVPANITRASAECKPHKLNVRVGYSDPSKKTGIQTIGKSTDYVYNSPEKIDTVYAGDFEFPFAYYGTGDYSPYLHVRSRVSASEAANYDEDIRIDCIILRPKELDNYLKEHPDYEYNRGNN